MFIENVVFGRNYRFVSAGMYVFKFLVSVNEVDDN